MIIFLVTNQGLARVFSSILIGGYLMREDEREREEKGRRL